MVVAISYVLRVLIPVIGILFILDIPTDWFGLLLWQEQIAIAILGLSVADIFLTSTLSGKSRAETKAPLPWYDALLAALALAITLYVGLRYETIVGSGYLGDPLNLALAVAMILMVAETTRRNAGMPMIVLLVTFFLYGLSAGLFPGFLRGRSIELNELIAYLFLDPNSMFGTPLAVVVTTVLAYVIFGSALFKLGGGDLFIGLALSVMGRFKGGAAKTSVLSSSLFGTISGSAVANVVADGIITIPLMKKSGYSPEEAGAIEAVASTGGQIMPPVMGAAAFIMANNLGVSYSEVAKAALIPALLFYFCVYLHCHFRACRIGARPLTAEERPNIKDVLRTGWPFLVPLFLLVGLMFSTALSPLKIALYATLAAVLSAFLKRETRPTLRQLMEILEDAGQGMLSLVPVVAVTGMMIGVLSVTGLGFTLSLGIVETAGGSMTMLLLLTAVAAIILGMGMPTTAVYIVLATLVAPALVKAGITPMAAHLYVFYYGSLSMITPPVCLAAFAGASLAGAGYMRTGYQAMKLGLAAFFIPVLFVLSPDLLLLGSSDAHELQMIVLACLGCVFLSASVEGFLFRTLNWPERLGVAVVAVIQAVAIGMPDGQDTVPSIVAFALSLIFMIWLWRQREPDSYALKRS